MSLHLGILMYALEKHTQPFQEGCTRLPGIMFCLIWNFLSKPGAYHTKKPFRQGVMHEILVGRGGAGRRRRKRKETVTIC